MEKTLNPVLTGTELAPAADFTPVNVGQLAPAVAEVPAAVTPSFTNHVADHHQTNVNVNLAAPAIHMSMQSNKLPFVVRALWFVFVGWWLSAFFITVGYVLTISILFLPVGLWFLNRVPQAQTLRARNVSMKTEFRDGAIYFTEGRTPQHPWYLRLLYLVVVGWWAGLLWLGLAWLLSVLIITLPVSIMMVDRTPQVITLQKN